MKSAVITRARLVDGPQDGAQVRVLAESTDGLPLTLHVGQPHADDVFVAWRAEPDALLRHRYVYRGDEQRWDAAKKDFVPTGVHVYYHEPKR